MPADTPPTGARPRLLLLIPTTTYRTEDFMEAAGRLDVDLVVASDRPNVMSAEFPDALLTLPFSDPDAAVAEMRAYAARRPLSAVVPVDDVTAVTAAAIAGALGLRANPVAAVAATRDKLEMRQRLAAAGVAAPAFTAFSVDDDPREAARRVRYPAVLKPLVLSASRGVIRADDEAGFAAAFARIAAILRAPDVCDLGPGARRILVEDFVPGVEVALEGLLVDGALETLALFDKPDPLDGPFFEETIYVTPSRLPAPAQAAARACAERAARALGLSDGPVHVELRLDTDPEGRDRAWLIEIAARSIGGLCSRTLSFGTGMSLEEIILRHALALPIASLARDRRAAGVMMIPIPAGGVLEEVEGLDAARAVPAVEDVVIAIHKGQEVVPLPEGSRYLGFIFSRADTPAAAEDALRQAHRRLRFVIRPGRVTATAAGQEEIAVSIVREFERAFNAQDVDGLVACFTPGASYTDTFFGEHTTSAGLRAMFARMFREGRDYRWAMETVVETPERAAAEWTFSYVVTDAVPRSAGRKIRFRGMSIFELEGGRIARYREYFDMGAALLQLGFAPESLAKVLARRV